MIATIRHELDQDQDAEQAQQDQPDDPLPAHACMVRGANLVAPGRTVP
jgi:hypothetical protein